MKRRTLLSTVAGITTLSGCGSLQATEKLATASIHSQDTIDEEHGISINAELANSTISSNKTATVEIRVKNISDEPTVVADRYPAFIPTTDDSADPKLQLLPTTGGYISNSSTIPSIVAKVEDALSSSTYVKSGRHCWVPKYSHAFEGRFIYRKLQPAEKFVNKYELWGVNETESEICLPNGEFHFSTEYFTQQAEKRPPEKIADWGFSVIIRQPTERQ